VDPLAIVIERQISYFADKDGLNGFLKYLGDNHWVRVFEVIRDGFNKDNPRKPFPFGMVLTTILKVLFVP
jgi:hypothetical protein